MKVVKKIILVLAILIAIPFVVALFVNKEYGVKRNITIEKPKAEVFNYIKYLKNQDNYSKWAQMDPDMKKTFTGTDGTVGFISSWDSDNKEVGRGEQEIMKIVPGERINFELRFFEPFKSTDNAYMLTEALTDSTTNVTWGFDGKMNYPMNLMLLFMNFEDMLGKDLSTGLEGLKKELEK